MLQQYLLNNLTVDSLDLKAMIVTRGVKVSGEIYRRFGATHRIHPDPEKCNCLILPDGTIVQLTDLALHMRFLKKAVLVAALRNLKHTMGLRTPFSLEVSANGRPVLLYDDVMVTEVSFPISSHFYEQQTSSGLPFLSNAVLQGVDFLSFQCLWPCEFAKAGYACQYCYAGGMTERLARLHHADPPLPTPRDVAEITKFAIITERSASHIQLTGGSTMNAQAECRRIVEYLHEIDSVVGLENIPGEMLIYTSPPQDPSEVDQLFRAGADRIACSLEVWDEELAKVITPGKAKFTGRQRALDCLTYIAEKYGPNKACSSFVVGVEPAESFLAGATYLAERGIVPIASIWIPFGRPVMGKTEAPNLDYYRRVKEGLAGIYEKYDIEPPGSVGLNVCLCRDTWRYQSEILQNENPVRPAMPELNYEICACSGRSLDKLVQPAILTVLANEDVHGYVLLQRLAEMPMFHGQKPDATGVYRVLRQMEMRNLVTSTWQSSESGPAKHQYGLTDNGRACLLHWVRALTTHHDALAELLAAARMAVADGE